MKTVAHHVSAELQQGMFDSIFGPSRRTVIGRRSDGIGELCRFTYTLPALADWLPHIASNTAHLARLLKENPYPGKS